MTYIARVRGAVLSRGPDHLVVDVAGVGYRAYVPAGTAAAAEVGAEITLHTHLQLRDDAIALYGFLGEDELALFEQLITVSGVGPRSAIAMLSILPAPDLRLAIASGATDLLRRVPGIGAKTAGRIILDLQSKIDAAAVPAALPGVAAAPDDVVAALRSLGYSQSEAMEALAATAGAAAVNTEERLRQALQYFSAKARS